MTERDGEIYRDTENERERDHSRPFMKYYIMVKHVADEPVGTKETI